LLHLAQPRDMMLEQFAVVGLVLVNGIDIGRPLLQIDVRAFLDLERFRLDFHAVPLCHGMRRLPRARGLVYHLPSAPRRKYDVASETMMDNPSFMFTEIGETAEAISRARAANAKALCDLAAELRALDPKVVVTNARGSYRSLRALLEIPGRDQFGDTLRLDRPLDRLAVRRPVAAARRAGDLVVAVRPQPRHHSRCSARPSGRAR